MIFKSDMLIFVVIISCKIAASRVPNAETAPVPRKSKPPINSSSPISMEKYASYPLRLTSLRWSDS